MSKIVDDIVDKSIIKYKVMTCTFIGIKSPSGHLIEIGSFYREENVDKFICDIKKSLTEIIGLAINSTE